MPTEAVVSSNISFYLQKKKGLTDLFLKLGVSTLHMTYFRLVLATLSSLGDLEYGLVKLKVPSKFSLSYPSYFKGAVCSSVCVCSM